VEEVGRRVRGTRRPRRGCRHDVGVLLHPAHGITVRRNTSVRPAEFGRDGRTGTGFLE
jgi:hypothetical protein